MKKFQAMVPLKIYFKSNDLRQIYRVTTSDEDHLL